MMKHGDVEGMNGALFGEPEKKPTTKLPTQNLNEDAVTGVETKYKKELVKMRNEMYRLAFNLHIHLTNGFTGGVDKRNDEAVRRMADAMQETLDNKNEIWDFVPFAKSLKDVTV